MGGEVIYGHTDFGTFTFLFRQPVAALQVRLEEEKTWKWVKPVPGSITVNVAVGLHRSHDHVALILTRPFRIPLAFSRADISSQVFIELFSHQRTSVMSQDSV